MSTKETHSLFSDAREALAALTNDAANSASDQGIDTVSSLDDDVRKALDAGEKYEAALREIADYVTAPGRPVLALMAWEALR